MDNHLMSCKFSQSARRPHHSNYSTLPMPMIPRFSRFRANMKTTFLTGGVGSKTYIAHFMRESVKKE